MADCQFDLCYNKLQKLEQAALMAEEKSPARISLRLLATSCSEVRIV